MSITVQEIADQTDDYTGNYTTSTIDPGAKLRSINRSVEYLKRRLGFPSDETIQTIDFCEDQFFYDLNTDFDEALGLQYHDPLLNTTDREWDYMPYKDLMKRTGNPNSNFLFSHTTVNGKNQLMILGQNFFKGSLVDSFDTVGNWVASGDASALAQDTLTKYRGDASLSFTATRSSGTATLTNASESLSFQSYFEKHGIVKLWTQLPNTTITNLILTIYVSGSKYWTITATAKDDGTAFTANEFVKIGFPLDDAVKTGLPLITDTITKLELNYTLAVGFATGTIRVDHMFVAIPDSLDLLYYTRYKGIDTTGVTDKILLTEMSDKLRIGEYFEDYIDVIARRAALSLTPQLRGDKDFYNAYMEDFREMMKTLGKSFPRKRIMNNFLRTSLKR